MVAVSWLLRNPLVRAVGAALAAVLAVLLYGRSKKKEGADEVEKELSELDRETADDIRGRVDAVQREPVRLRPDDQRGYRD